MNTRDTALLEDMRHNARLATDLARGLSADELRLAYPALYSTLHAIQIVGEAASRISSETQADAPQVPWREIIATRHIIVHGYRAVDPAIIIAIVEDYLPTLIVELDRILARD